MWWLMWCFVQSRDNSEHSFPLPIPQLGYIYEKLSLICFMTGTILEHLFPEFLFYRVKALQKINPSSSTDLWTFSSPVSETEIIAIGRKDKREEGHNPMTKEGLFFWVRECYSLWIFLILLWTTKIRNQCLGISATVNGLWSHIDLALNLSPLIPSCRNWSKLICSHQGTSGPCPYSSITIPPKVLEKKNSVQDLLLDPTNSYLF